MTTALGLFHHPGPDSVAASSPGLAASSLSLSPPSPIAEDILTPTQHFLRRPSLPRRTVSDFSTGTDASGTARRRRSLANGHAYRMRASRRPSTAASTEDKLPAGPRNPLPMVRSVSLPVATRTEFERQCQEQHQRLISVSGTQTASQVAWSFKWPTSQSHPHLQPGELSNRRPSSCSPFETNPVLHESLQESDGFPWSAACLDMPGLSPSSSSSSISSSRTASTGPPSPRDGFAVLSHTRRTSSPSFSRGAMSGYSLTAKSSPGSSSPSPRSPLSPLSQRINLYNGPDWSPQIHGGGGGDPRSLQLDGSLTSRRTSSDSYEKKGAPYPSPQRRLSSNRMLAEALGFGQERRSSFTAPELAPHLEENESCPASPPAPFSQHDADQLVAKLEPLAITQHHQTVPFVLPLPTVSLNDDDDDIKGAFAVPTSAGFVAAEEEDEDDDGMLTPRAGSPLPGMGRRYVSTSEPGYLTNKIQPSSLPVRMCEDRTVIPQTRAPHQSGDVFDNTFDHLDCNVIITPHGERIVIHPDHHSLPPIPM